MAIGTGRSHQLAAPQVGARRLRTGSLALAASLIVVALILPFFVRNFLLFQLTMMMVYAVAILGLNLLTGFNGQFSLGHSAFFAIGAYTAAILMETGGVPYLLTLPAAAAICFLAGFLFGLPALRLDGLYLALATYGLALAMPQILKLSPLEPWTGGVQGIVVIKPDAPFGLRLSQDQWLYFVTLGVGAAMYLGARNLVGSRTGRAMMAIRDNPIAAGSMGVNTALYKSLTFGVSALYTGVAGALGAIVVQFVAPDSFTFTLSIALFVGMVVGGVDWLPGALVGGAFVLFVPNLAESVSKGLSGAVYGAILILVIYVMPSGFGGLVKRALGYFRRRNNFVRRGRTTKMNRRVFGIIAPFAVLAAIAAEPAVAQKRYDPGPGASDTEIRIGNIMPYSGPASAYGVIGKTQEAFFKKVNAEGGINGRKVVFISYDDGYSPPKAVEQVRKLVESDEVLLVFQPLGTPSNSAIMRYMNGKKVPQLFVASGATKFGENPKTSPYTMGWQPNYQSEGRIYARYILDNVPDAKIAVLFQNDDYGKDLLKGLKDGLGEKARSSIVAEAPYEVSEPTVDSQIVKLKASGANLFINIATPKFAAQAIRKVAEIGWTPVQILNNLSNSIGGVINPAGAANAKGILSAAYFKTATDPTWMGDAGMRDWRDFLVRYFPDADQTDSNVIYGYLTSQSLLQVLKQCGDDLTRENVMRQAANLKDFELPLLLPGIKINTGPDDYYPIEQLQMMRFTGERWELFGPVLTGKVSQ